MGANFSHFMYKHSIPSTAAAFSIGGASAEMAKTMANDIVLPLVYGMLSAWKPVKQAPRFQIKPFLHTLVVWVCVLVTSYLLMEFVFARGVIGVSTVVMSNKDKEELNKARAEAGKPLEKAKSIVRDMVVGASTDKEYAEITAAPPSVMPPDHRRLSPGGPVTLKPSSVEFDGSSSGVPP